MAELTDLEKLQKRVEDLEKFQTNVGIVDSLFVKSKTLSGRVLEAYSDIALLQRKVENLEHFIKGNNNDIAEIVINSRTYEQYRQLLHNYYYMLAFEKTQDKIISDGYYISDEESDEEEQRYQPKYQEYRKHFEDWVKKVSKQSKVVKGGRTRKNKKSRK